MIKVKERMSAGFKTLPKTATCMDVAKLFAEHRIGSVYLTEGEEIEGIITETDLARKVMAEGKDPSATPAKGVMTTRLCNIDAEADVSAAFDIMDREHIRHLGVIIDGKISGILSVRDLIKPIYHDGEGW